MFLKVSIEFYRIFVGLRLEVWAFGFWELLKARLRTLLDSSLRFILLLSWVFMVLHRSVSCCAILLFGRSASSKPNFRSLMFHLRLPSVSMRVMLFRECVGP